ncbi:MAG: DMT family transporter [Chloroflexota bacterium]|nr:DMT family transporter [Chloroflexota bacterium]MEC9365950.1 DMT family transporter [Chloroflexota bacterium]MED6296157.1 DMT family transporter [Chloroflexota bacterium]
MVINDAIVLSIVFGVLGATAIGIADLITIGLARKIGLINTGLWEKLLAVLIVSPYFLFTTLESGVMLERWELLVLLGFVNLITYLVLIKSLQIGPVSVIAPLTTLFSIVSLGLAYLFLDEKLTYIQAVLIGIALTGAVVTVLRSGNFSLVSSSLTAGVLLGLLATLLVGAQMFLQGAISKQIGWFPAVYFPMMLSIFGFIPVSFYKGEIPWQRLSFKSFILLIITSSLKIGGFFLFAKGAELGSVGMVSVGTTTYPLIPIIVGVLLFKERLTFTQIIGISLLLGSLATLAAS